MTSSIQFKAVFSSWNNPCNIQNPGIQQSHHLGTAVNVQSMVFGNMAIPPVPVCVAFTRNPATGEKVYSFLQNAQGEDVVAGITGRQSPLTVWHEIFPDIHEQFSNIANLLETHYRDMQI